MSKYQVKCYENPRVLNEVRKAIASIEHKITNTASVENRIMNRVGKYLAMKEENKNHLAYIRRLIYGEIAATATRNRKEEAGSLVVREADGLLFSEIEVPDERADATGGIELSEILSALADGDERRKFILHEWISGVSNDSEIARDMCDLFGGIEGSNRSFIIRFRNQCRKRLTNEV